MSKFTFGKSSSTTQSPITIQDGLHVAVVVQVAHIGLQLAFDRNKEPEGQMAVAFEVASGELIAKRMKFSDHPSSGCFAMCIPIKPWPDSNSFNNKVPLP